MGGESTLKVTATATGVSVALVTTNPWLIVAGIAGLAVVGVVAAVSNSGSAQKN